MAESSAEREDRLAHRGIFDMNVAAAVLGGLSLVVPMVAPLSLGMSGMPPSPGSLFVLALISGFPFASAASIVVSRWMLHQGKRLALALVIASIPVALGVAGIAYLFAGAG